MAKFELSSFNPKESLYIEASAGTGKTHTIQLIVAKLLARDVPLKNILIVTYTDKAAGELKDRIRGKINEVLQYKKIDKDSDIEQPEDKDLNLNLFEKAARDVDNASIFTIHSFCQKTLKEFAYDAGRPFDVMMVNDDEVENNIDEFIRDKWANMSEFRQILENGKGIDSDTNKIREILVKAINLYKGCSGNDEIVRISNSIPVVWMGDCISESDARRMAKKCTYEDLLLFPEFKRNIELLAKYKDQSYTAIAGTKNKQKIKKEFTVANLLDRLLSWNSEVTTNPFTEGNVGSKITQVSDEFKAPLKYVLDRAIPLHKSGGIIDSLNAYLGYDLPKNKFLATQTPILFKEWLDYKSERKLQSFNDMILKVRNAVVEEKGSLKTKLRAQYLYAIIDEFQDTNQLQWDIFKTVFLEEGNKKVANHSIFVVGDPKQSIYSFQGADVNVYKKAIDEIGNGCTLENNFRSTNGMIEGCNTLFSGTFFLKNHNKFPFNKSFPPPQENQQKIEPQIDGECVPSIWLSENGVDEKAYAQAVVKKIIDWCSFTGNKQNRKTRLQVFKSKKEPKIYRNVSFKDFAILARSRSEIKLFKECLQDAGVPHSLYKETALFKSRECAEWIALFKALNSPDFSGWNRKYLNEALITDFFQVKNSTEEGLKALNNVQSDVFDNPENEERKFLSNWRVLALKRRYAEMLERIYEDSHIDVRLTEISRLQELTRLRQIGNYAIDYLYSHNASMEDLIRHLEGVSKFTENADDENGDLVEKGSDYDAVQLMTIHASKGLEFPVVISGAGFIGHYDNAKGPFLYHQENDIYLGFDDAAKSKRRQEEIEEWERLFYVDFTRATSLLIIPRFSKWDDNEDYTFLQKSLENISEGPFFRVFNVDDESSWDSQNLLKSVTNILNENAESKKISGSLMELVDQQKGVMSALQGKLGGKAILQYSYSNLAKRKGDDNIDANVVEALEGRSDSAEESETSLADDANEQNKNIDLDVVECACKEESISSTEPSAEIQKWKEVEKTYPRGNKVGNVLHNTLEWLQFSKLFEENTDKDSYKTFDAACSYSDLIEKLKDEFKEQSLPIGEHESDWIKLSIWFIWNTLHAKLPVINGGEFKDAEPFTLASLPDSNHKPEVQFGLTAELDKKTNSYLHKFCKGFIDLLFVRPDADGNKRFSILDWKSDYLEEYSAKAIKEKVDKEYSVQRVLYSYCLIQWLKQFYGPGTQENLKDEQKIFEKHFGGIYYAFLRGTDGQTQRGIYAQTWENFKKLEDAYIEVKNLMKKGSDNEEEN